MSVIYGDAIFAMAINVVENFLFNRMYQDKLANLKDQLKQLENGTHPEYVAGVKKLEDEFNSRLLHNETYLQCEVIVDSYFENEVPSGGNVKI